MKFILGKKLGMTQVFREDGAVVPVTRVQAGPCVVTQVKKQEKDGVNSVQIGFGKQAAFRLSKAVQGHLNGIDPVAHMRDFRTGTEAHGLKRGDTFTVGIFKPGEKVQVVGFSKGKGFQGVVKRHGFAGSPATHGHKDQLRMPGSIGAGGVQRVFKGMRMGGRTGNDRITVKNLEVIGIDEAQHEILVKGALPGARGSLLMISTDDGMIEITLNPEVMESQATSEMNDEVQQDVTGEGNTVAQEQEEKQSA